MENERNTVKVVIAGREVEIDSYKLPEIIVITGDPHASDLNPYRIVERGTRGSIPLPGGFYGIDYRDAYNRAEDVRVEESLAEALRSLHLDREIGEYAIPDVSMSMDLELSKGAVKELRERLVILEDNHLCVAREFRSKPFYIEQNPDHGQPRSIRETMRRNRPSKRRGRR